MLVKHTSSLQWFPLNFTTWILQILKWAMKNLLNLPWQKLTAGSEYFLKDTDVESLVLNFSFQSSGTLSFISYSLQRQILPASFPPHFLSLPLNLCAYLWLCFLKEEHLSSIPASTLWDPDIPQLLILILSSRFHYQGWQLLKTEYWKIILCSFSFLVLSIYQSFSFSFILVPRDL